HIYAALAFDVMGVNAVIVPYKGNAIMVPALISNEIQAVLADSFIRSSVDSGKVAALAVTSSRRLSQFPTVPTMREADLPQLDNIGFWIGLAAPPEASRQDVAKLNAAFNPTLADATVVK